MRDDLVAYLMTPWFFPFAPRRNFRFTQYLQETVCQAHSCVKVNSGSVSNLVRNVPFVTSLEVSPFLFWFLLFFSSLAWPGA